MAATELLSSALGAVAVAPEGSAEGLEMVEVPGVHHGGDETLVAKEEEEEEELPALQ